MWNKQILWKCTWDAEIELVLFTLPNEMIRDRASKQWSGQRHKPRDHIKHPILSSNRIENALTNDNIKRPVVGKNYIKSSCVSSSQSAQKNILWLNILFSNIVRYHQYNIIGKYTGSVNTNKKRNNHWNQLMCNAWPTLAEGNMSLKNVGSHEMSV